MKRRNKREGSERVHDVTVLMAGAGLGVAIALLAAPTSGEEVRHAIGRACRKAVRKIDRRTEHMRDRAADLVARAQDFRERRSKLFHIGHNR